MNSHTVRAEAPIYDPETWLDEYGDRLYTFALRRVRNAETAEDLVQETLIAGINGIEGFSGTVDLCSWLIGILRNKIFEHYRSTRREQLFEHDDMDSVIRKKNFDLLGTWKKSPSSWGSDPDMVLNSKEFLERLQHCLSNLPSRLREVFIMHTFDRSSPAAIGATLKISEDNLWVSLYRGRMALRECIDKNWLNIDKE